MHTPLTYDSYDKIDLKEAEELLEHQYFICASHLNGFILKDRIYGEYSHYRDCPNANV